MGLFADLHRAFQRLVGGGGIETRMTGSEDADLGQGRGTRVEGFGGSVKLRGDIGDEGRSVEIEMNLASMADQRMAQHFTIMPERTGEWCV
jgi:hypothetical protein